MLRPAAVEIRKEVIVVRGQKEKLRFCILGISDPCHRSWIIPIGKVILALFLPASCNNLNVDSMSEFCCTEARLNTPSMVDEEASPSRTTRMSA